MNMVEPKHFSGLRGALTNPVFVGLRNDFVVLGILTSVLLSIAVYFFSKIEL